MSAFLYMGNDMLLRRAQTLHEMASGLYAVHRDVFDKAKRAYETATAI